MADKEQRSSMASVSANPKTRTSHVSVDRILGGIADYGMWALTGFVVLFLWTPLLLIIFLSFAENSVSLFPFEGFTVQHYIDLFTHRSILDSTQQSVIVATTSAVIATLLGVPTAFAIARHTFLGKEALRALVILPLLIPGVIMGIAMLIFFRAGGLSPGFLTTVLAHSVFGFPFIVLPVVARLVTFDQSLEESARDLGADTSTVLQDITLPIIAPAIGAGFIFAWLRSFEDFIRVLFVSGTMDMLTKEMFGMVVYAQETQVMDPLATLLVVVVLIALFVAVNIGDILKYV